MDRSRTLWRILSRRSVSPLLLVDMEVIGRTKIRVCGLPIFSIQELIVCSGVFLHLLSQYGDDFKRIAASMPNKVSLFLPTISPLSSPFLRLRFKLVHSTERILTQWVWTRSSQVHPSALRHQTTSREVCGSKSPFVACGSTRILAHQRKPTS